MGRYNFTPSRVYRTATALMESKHLKDRPTWYDTIGQIPPAEILTRPQPVQLRELPRRLQNKKPSKMFKPQHIVYQEDKIRTNFYSDHPWELARPRVILEQDGKDGQRADWSTMYQPGRQLNGESVVQRQLWLLNNVEGMTSAQAYDQARHEFYELRQQQEVEQRVAKEEALSTGAYFGKSMIEVGLQLEDESVERWKEWAKKEIDTIQQQRDAAYSGRSTDEDSSSLLIDDASDDMPAEAEAEEQT